MRILARSTSTERTFVGGTWLEAHVTGWQPQVSYLLASWCCLSCGYRLVVTDKSKTQLGTGILWSVARSHLCIPPHA